MSLTDLSTTKQYKILNKVSTLAGAMATHLLLEKAWKVVTKHDPPRNPGAPDVIWREALLWGAATGLAAGLTKIIMSKAADASWRKYKGPRPANV